MTVGWMIFEVAINLFQSILYLFFLKSCVPLAKKSWLADCFCVTACAVFYSLYLFWNIPVTDSLNVLIFFVYLCFVSKERWYVLALWVIIKEVIVVTTVGIMLAICQALTSASREMLMEPGMPRIIFVLSTNFVLFLVFFIFSRSIRKTDSPLAVPALLYFLVTNIAVFFAIEMLFSVQVSHINDLDWHIFAAYGAMFVCSVLSVFLYHTMTAVVQKENQSQIALNHAQMTKQHQQMLKDIYQDTIARQHDLKNQLQTIEQLVAQGNSKTAKEYLAEYEKAINRSEPFMTGSIAVDALLTAKLLTCKQNHVEFLFTQYPLSHLPISEVDFCAIVGNLLDNAIEGVNRISNATSPREIHLSFNRIWDTFIIRCENNMASETIKHDGKKFITSKQTDRAIHGFGIRNIEAIAKKADGFCDFETQKSLFIASVTMPYPLREADEDAQAIRISRSDFGKESENTSG
ncbi:MAG: GHKL domain-containing protein [Clostridia bacterium]